MKREILQFRSRQSQKPSPQSPVIKLPPREETVDIKKVRIGFPKSRDIEDRIAKSALELDDYQVQSCARARDCIKIFMRANALLIGRPTVTMSDLLLGRMDQRTNGLANQDLNAKHLS